MGLRIIFGRSLIQRAETKGTLPPTQWGSRPNRSPTDCVFLKRLSYDGLKIVKQHAIIFNNDAKAAFDRMIPSIGGIALRRLGASQNAVATLLWTLERMRYQIRTALGISEQEYSNLQDWVRGTLQGSGASPCLWLAVTCILLGAISKQSLGITFKTPGRLYNFSALARLTLTIRTFGTQLNNQPWKQWRKRCRKQLSSGSNSCSLPAVHLH